MFLPVEICRLLFLFFVSIFCVICMVRQHLCAGFNSVLRRGYVTYQEYIQVGKGRDVGLIQISKFEAKVANGNSEQTLSRDIYRLGQQFDFFRMLSCYYTTIGFYFSNLVCFVTAFPFLFPFYSSFCIILVSMRSYFE